ncbi:hypothetical protein VTK56DRAFT_1678 [Thermocarpiscus australiensis]
MKLVGRSIVATWFNLHAATLVSRDISFLQLVIDEIRRLTEKYPDGYVNEDEHATTQE